MKFGGVKLTVFLMLAIANPVFAHPGNTAADGCHYCRTNCAKWGEIQGARHCHGGESAAPNYTPPPAPTYTPPPAPKKTAPLAPAYTPPPASPLTVAPVKTPTPSDTVIENTNQGTDGAVLGTEDTSGGSGGWLWALAGGGVVGYWIAKRRKGDQGE